MSEVLGPFEHAQKGSSVASMAQYEELHRQSLERSEEFWRDQLQVPPSSSLLSSPL